MATPVARTDRARRPWPAARRSMGGHDRGLGMGPVDRLVDRSHAGDLQLLVVGQAQKRASVPPGRRMRRISAIAASRSKWWNALPTTTRSSLRHRTASTPPSPRSRGPKGTVPPAPPACSSQAPRRSGRRRVAGIDPRAAGPPPGRRPSNWVRCRRARRPRRPPPARTRGEARRSAASTTSKLKPVMIESLEGAGHQGRCPWSPAPREDASRARPRPARGGPSPPASRLPCRSR